MTKDSFPANTVVNSYIRTESVVADFLSQVPYCTEHAEIWSPTLATVLLETCSQLDSLWKCQAGQSRFVTKERLDIRDYYSCFRDDVAPRWVVSYGEEPSVLKPYEKWEGSQEYGALEWWDAYNKVKHNRLQQRKQATMKNAIMALAGLFIAIIRCEACRAALVQAGWVSCLSGHPVPGALSDDSPSDTLRYCAVESRLFSYGVGWSKKPPDELNLWGGPASPRFAHWCQTHARKPQ